MSPDRASDPECAAGKHVNCTGWALDEDLGPYHEVACGCDCQALIQAARSG
jgi:hypothetical protein